MSNGILGLQSIGRMISFTFNSIMMDSGVSGFLIGFLSAGIVAILLISEHPGRVPIILTRSPSASFTHLHTRGNKGTYMVSYSAFQHEYNRVRIAFYVTFSVFLIVIAIAMWKY